MTAHITITRVVLVMSVIAFVLSVGAVASAAWAIVELNSTQDRQADAAKDNFTSRRVATRKACVDRELGKTDSIALARYFAGRFHFTVRPEDFPRREDGTRIYAPLILHQAGKTITGVAACTVYARRAVPRSSNPQ